MQKIQSLALNLIGIRGNLRSLDVLSRIVICMILTSWILLASETKAQRVERSHPSHFIYFGLERSRIADAAFLETKNIAGAQLKYTWKELEPERGRYDLTAIHSDLEFLEKHDKRLFIQLQEVSFEERIINVPDYLLTDPQFNGGVARQYSFENDDESKPVAEGWVAHRWDPVVRERFVLLLQAMGEALDGRIEGINFPETSVGFGDSGAFHPTGYTDEVYAEAVETIMTAGKAAFPTSEVIQYANFMPGEWLPGGDRGFLKGVYEHADSIGAGVGGPDLLPNRRWQRRHSYPLIASRGPNTKAGVAVQWGNLDDVNPDTGEQVTVEQLYRYAVEELRLDYIFWGIQEPHYSNEILSFLARQDEIYLDVQLGFDAAGRPTPAWIEAIRNRHDEATLDELAAGEYALSAEQQNWRELVQNHASTWTGWIDSLAIPFGGIDPPDTVFVLMGNAGGEDAFTSGDSTIGFDLGRLHEVYGDATSAENAGRIDRFFAHEMTHILHKAWRMANPVEIESTLDYALWDCLVEGIGNYRSLSSKWVSPAGELTLYAESVLEELQTEFVENLLALEHAGEAEAALLLRSLSSGPFTRKWGALTTALWLAQEAQGDEAKLRPWIEAGPPGVLVLARKYLPVELRERLDGLGSF